MAKAPEFNPSIQFSELSSYDGESLDVVFAEIKATLDSLIANQNAITRDDQKLENGSVHAAALSSEALALVAGNWDNTGDFATDTDYKKDQSYLSSGVLYLVLIDHTSTVVVTDVALGYVVAITTSLTTPSISGVGMYSSAGSGNIYTVVISGSTPLTDGENFILTPNHTNTAASTINRDSIGAKSITTKGRQLRAGELNIGRAVYLVYNAAIDSYEIIGQIPDLSSDSNINGLKISVTSNTAFDVSYDDITLINDSGDTLYISSGAISTPVASSIMNGTYNYVNDKWYDIYILNSGKSGEVSIINLVPDGSAFVDNSAYPYVKRVGSIRDDSGNLRKSIQIGNRVHFNDSNGVRPMAVLASAAFESVDLVLPQSADQAMLSFFGVYGDVEATLSVRPISLFSGEIKIYTISSSSVNPAVHGVYYTQLDSSNKIIDVSYSAGATNQLQVNVDGFIWR